jgi:hypothetical protein
MDDRPRGQIKEIAKTFGNRYVDRAEVVRLPSVEGNNDTLDSFVRNGMLIEHFQVICPSCKHRYLAYGDKARAESAAKNSDGCASCDSQQLTTTSILSVPEPYSRTVHHNLWLTQLARDTAQKWTRFVWAGQMVGPSEMDVLAVFADKVILMDCRDGSFGLSDLDQTAGKAARASADVVITISTQELHPNVNDALRDSPSKERTFLSIATTSANQIQQNLNDVFEQMAKSHAKKWLDGRGLWAR